MAGRVPLRAVLAIGVLGLVLRLGFVAWAPGGLVGDARAYDQQARILLAGDGYVHLDGSPAVRWMPGWSVTVAGLYAAFGAEPHVAMAGNAVLGAATASLVAVLGCLLVGSQAGLVAGALYALWPGVVYYAAVLMSEVLVTFLMVLAFVLVAASGNAQGRRSFVGLTAAGVVFGLAAWVRGEPLVLLGLAVLHLWAMAPGWRSFLGRALLLVVLSVAVVSPWILRNQAAFGRFVPTAGSGGIAFWIANREGASGANDPLAGRRLHGRFENLSLGESTLAASDAGYREAWQDVRNDPGAAGCRALHKLALTYSSDASAVAMIRGFAGELAVRPSRRIPPAGFISRSAQVRLATLANVWWAGVLAAAALGLTCSRVWAPAARWLVLAPLGFWLVLHVVMIGGSRYHFSETPFLAILAGCGAVQLTTLARRVRSRREG